MKELTAGGGVLYRQKGDRTQVVLIYRRGVWDLPKGKKEEGENIAECAMREVAEEVGIPLPVIDSELGTTYHEYMLDGTPVGKKTYWYAMRTQNGASFTPQREEDIEQVDWVDLDTAREQVGFDNLREILAAFALWREQSA